MPEQPTLSIKVTVAPQIAGGLHALAREHLTRAPAAKKPARTGGAVTNTISGVVHGHVYQGGDVQGPLNLNWGR
ncbi:hypothetical protein [Lentzea sp. NPDC004782]|uniref:hypothetical protein n=1 Tax=Lentzea sp. NPDC004782 TaxID=3154458 RepID=UPI0033B43025